MGNDQPSKAKVLIVEDEVLIAEDLENRLKDLGYEVCGKTATGEDALLRTDRDRPDLVIMDLVLRGETDGIEAAEVIRNNWGIPVVFLTAYADAARLERAKLAYPFGYLLKPFQERDLKITLEMALYVDRERRERKKMEEALRESESTYRLLFESSSDALFIHGLREDGFPSRFLDVNDVACERLGYTRKELLTLSPLDIGVEGLGETVRARGKALLEKGRTVFETIHVTKDGRSIPVESSASVFEFKGRQAVLSIARDITERKKSEAAIREGQARLHLALDAAKAGVWEWDPLTKESVWSEQIWDLYALEPHSCEPSYECWRRSIVPEDRNKVELAVREAVRSGCELATEWRVMDPDGTIRWLMSRGRPLADASGRITRHLGVAIDITDRKRADEAVRESEATYRSLFEYMLNGFAYCRMIFENGQPQDYVYLKVNEAFENLTGLNGVTGRNVSDVIPGIREADPSLFEILGRVSLTGRPERFEMFLKSLRMWFQISVYSPKPEHFVAIFDVITDRKRAEQQLKAAYSKLEALWSVSSLADADLKTVSDHILATIGRMTNSEYGFYGLVNEDESVMTIHSWSGEAMRDCAMTHKPREVPIDEAGVWGEAIRRRAPFVLNDFQAAGAARKGLPEGHVPLFNIMVVPGIVHGRISSMAAVANRIGGYTDEELTQITAFLGNIQAITDNKRAEEALRESEKRYRAIFEQASAGMVDCAPDGRFIKVNQRFCDMTGYTADELYRLTFREITHPEDLELDLEYIRKTLAGEIPGFIREKRYIRKDGKIVWVNLSVSLVRDTEGKPANYIVVVHDISDEKRLTQALRRNEEQLRLINDSIQDMIYSYDRGNRFTFANRRLCQVLRMRADQIIGKTYYELGFPEAACREWDEMHRRVHETDSTVQGTISMPGRDGRIYHLDMVLNPLHDDNGAVVGIVGSTRDITDRKDAEDALQKSEDRYRRLTENSPDIILRFDRAGRHLYASPTASQMAPIEPAGFIGRTSRELGFPEALCDFWEANVKTVFETGQPRMEQFDLDGPGGTVVFDWRLVPEIGPEADIESVLSIARDITERKRHETEKENLENQLRHAQKMESVGTLAGGVAHDFNNLLQAINGYTQLLLMNQEKGSLDRPKLKEIEKACERASLLVRQLLLFSRKAEADRRPVDLNQALEQASRLLERTIPKMVDIELHPGRDLWTVQADPVQIEQALLNLGGNAADAMTEGGRLVIETRNIVLDEEYTRGHLGAILGKYVLLSVSDTGVGMDRETQAHIFDPFFTTKEFGKGTGLGLASVYGVVKGHGGYITCYSEPGLGTTFKIYLPAIEPGEAEPAVHETQDLPQGGTETILIVDDEAPIRDFASQVLRHFGYTVLTASNGQEALQVYSNEENRIDLVILDIGMPVMGGHQCLRALRRADPRVKVLVASGYSINGQVKNVMESGALGFVSKPYQLRDLLAGVRKALDESH